MPADSILPKIQPADVLAIRDILLRAIGNLWMVRGQAGLVLEEHHQKPKDAIQTLQHAPELGRLITLAWKLRDELNGVYRGRVIAENALLDATGQSRAVDFEFLCAQAALEAGWFVPLPETTRRMRDGVERHDSPRTDTSACAAVEADLNHIARQSHPSYWLELITNPVEQDMAINALYDLAGHGFSRPADAIDAIGVRDTVIDELVRVHRMVTNAQGEKNGALHPDDVKILRALNKAKMTLTQEKLEQLTQLDVKTIRERLKRLRSDGLTHRPCGEKGGETITEHGRAALATIPAGPKDSA